MKLTRYSPWDLDKKAKRLTLHLPMKNDPIWIQNVRVLNGERERLIFTNRNWSFSPNHAFNLLRSMSESEVFFFFFLVCTFSFNKKWRLLLQAYQLCLHFHLASKATHSNKLYSFKAYDLNYSQRSN